jgi:transposase InsO family protein
LSGRPICLRAPAKPSPCTRPNRKATSAGQRRDSVGFSRSASPLAAWRRDYNEVRPHGSIGRIPPARFAEQHRRHAGDAARHLTPASNEIQ